MRIVIIEPLLKNQSGHQFLYTVGLQSELEKQNIEVYILGNIQAEEAGLKIKNFYPCLTEITLEAYAGVIGFKQLTRIYKLMQLLCRQLDSFFKLDFKLQSQDILFMHALYIFELLAFAWFLNRQTRLLIHNHNKIFIGLNFSYKQSSLALTLILAFLYRYIFRFLVRRLKSQLVYFSDGVELASEYQRLLRKKIHILPAPVNNQFLQTSVMYSQSETTHKGCRVISYLGGARYNKGFDLFVPIVKDLFKEKDLIKKILLNIQIDIHPRQSGQQKSHILKAAGELKSFAERFANPKLIWGILSWEEYYNLLQSTDIVVLPYRELPFESNPSNVFRETVVLGKIPLVSMHTTMAGDLIKHNLGELVFKPNNSESFIYALKKVINNFDAYQVKITRLQKEWLDYFSASQLVQDILTFAS